MHNSRLLIILVSGTLTLNSLMAAGDDWMLIAAEIKSQSKENTPQSRAKLWVRYKQEKQVWMTIVFTLCHSINHLEILD